MAETLEIYDLDGTCTTIDMIAGLSGEEDAEVTYYYAAAVEFLVQTTGGEEWEISMELQQIIMEDIYDHRHEVQNWARFPDSDGQMQPAFPAVDHYALILKAVEKYIEKTPFTKMAFEEMTNANWRNIFYKYCSQQSLEHTELDEDAVEVLRDAINRRANAVIVTNSSTNKAATLLKRAGFTDDEISIGHAEKGKIGIVGGAEKFKIDTTAPESTLDLSSYYEGEKAILDLRRTTFFKILNRLVEETGAAKLHIVDDIAELTNHAVEAHFRDTNIEVTHAIRENPTSYPGSLQAARELLNAKVSTKLSELTPMAMAA